MYAVIETGGKQYRVAPGDVIEVERLDASAAGSKKAKKVTFDRVLLIRDDTSVRVGRPLVEGASVTAAPLGDVRGRKITVFKMKRRKGYRRHRGHRQELTRVKIEKIVG